MSEERYCTTCGHLKWKDGNGQGCSEFCAIMSDAVIEAWRRLKPGEYGLWPCPICGRAVEDIYDPDTCCLGCEPRLDLRRSVALLKEAKSYGMPVHLADRVEAFISKHDSG